MSEYFLGNYDLAPDQETLVAIVQAAGKVLEERGAEGLENGRRKIDDSRVVLLRTFLHISYRQK